MKLWIDDLRSAPNGYIWLHSTNETIKLLNDIENALDEWDLPPADLFVEVIDIDHDAGDYACDGGDYIEILKWMERNKIAWPIHLHTFNPVGRKNMQAIIRKNRWKEII